MAILVTGATGFVGSNIAAWLVQQGESVIAFDLPPSDPNQRLLALPHSDRVSVVYGDLLNRAELEQFANCAHITGIVHAAAVTPRSDERERELFRAIAEVNYLGTVNILQLARSLPALRRVVYVSSTSVYGSLLTQRTLTEELSVMPDSLYGITKYACELTCLRWRELFGVDIVCARLSSVYGPREHETSSRKAMSVIHDLVRMALARQEIKLNALEETTDWIHAYDVAGGVKALLEAPKLDYAVYNLAAGHTHSVGEIIEVLLNLIPEMHYRIVPESEANVRVNPYYQEGKTDNNRLVTEVGFGIRYPLHEGLAQYVQWLSAKNQS